MKEYLRSTRMAHKYYQVYGCVLKESSEDTGQLGSRCSFRLNYLNRSDDVRESLRLYKYRLCKIYPHQHKQCWKEHIDATEKK